MIKKLLTAMLGIALLCVFSLPLAAEKQPHMRAALDALRQAEQHLKQASHDKGGHRAAALQATQSAIKHVEEGIKYDNQHESRAEEKREHRH